MISSKFAGPVFFPGLLIDQLTSSLSIVIEIDMTAIADNNWEVQQSSRKRHRMDRSSSRKNSHSRERGIHKFMKGAHQGTCHMTVHKIMECVAGAITQVKSQGQIKAALV